MGPVLDCNHRAGDGQGECTPQRAPGAAAAPASQPNRPLLLQWLQSERDRLQDLPVIVLYGMWCPLLLYLICYRQVYHAPMPHAAAAVGASAPGWLAWPG
jgi:hypothetical protein